MLLTPALLLMTSAAYRAISRNEESWEIQSVVKLHGLPHLRAETAEQMLLTSQETSTQHSWCGGWQHRSHCWGCRGQHLGRKRQHLGLGCRWAPATPGARNEHLAANSQQLRLTRKSCLLCECQHPETLCSRLPSNPLKCSLGPVTDPWAQHHAGQRREGP